MINFILGILFAIVGLPIIQTLANLICSWMDIGCAKNNLAINKYNSKLADLIEPPASTSVIGFQCIDEPEGDEFDYDEE